MASVQPPRSPLPRAPSGDGRLRASDPGPLLTRERALVLVLVILTAVACYLTYRLAQPFLPALAWAIALGVVAYPLHRALARRLGWPSVAAALTVAVVALLVLAPVVLISQRLAGEAAHAAEVVQSAGGQWWERLTSHPRLGALLRWAQVRVDLQELTGRAGEAVTGKSGAILSGSIWVVMQLLVTLFVLFYLFRDHRAAERLARSLLPLSDAEADVVLQRLGDTIRATVSGALGVAAIQGALGGLMFWFLGLPAPLFWGVTMALLATIPMAGTFLVWAPAALFLALSGSWGKALILVAWGSTAIALIDNILYPYLVGSRLRLHPVPVFIAIVGGISLYGAAGIILGPITLAVAVALIDVWRARTADGSPAEIPAGAGAIAAAGASVSPPAPAGKQSPSGA